MSIRMLVTLFEALRLLDFLSILDVIPEHYTAQHARREIPVKKLLTFLPIRPISMTAEMAKDYRIFKAAGLLSKWRRKWAAYLPTPD